ncbi:Late Embryogenesis Abundant protein, partial [Polypedilum vanderplanki]
MEDKSKFGQAKDKLMEAASLTKEGTKETYYSAKGAVIGAKEATVEKYEAAKGTAAGVKDALKEKLK